MQHLPAQPQDGGTDQLTTMDPDTTTIITAFHLLGLPEEIRDEIYEMIIFDLSPPPLSPTGIMGVTFPYRSMNVNILLTSRKVYWEARDVIVRRGQLVMVSATQLHGVVWGLHRAPVSMLMGFSGITVIDPKYRNLCIMHHRINALPAVHALTSAQPRDRPRKSGDWKFILHRKDVKSFCHSLMGKFNENAETILGPKAKHTLMLQCYPGYAQQDCNGIYSAQMQILQDYRGILRIFEDISILGTSAGWKDGLYPATLKDIRSNDGKVVGGFINDLLILEKEGWDIMSQTGDFEAAYAAWVKAEGVGRIAVDSFEYSTETLTLPDCFDRTSFGANFDRWRELTRIHGEACIGPVLDLIYRITNHRLSTILQLIQQGRHLRGRHGRAPLSVSDYMYHVWMLFNRATGLAATTLAADVWSPEPFEEVQMCCTVAAIFRLLDASHKAAAALNVMRRAIELAPDDQAVIQERDLMLGWMRRSQRPSEVAPLFPWVPGY